MNRMGAKGENVFTACLRGIADRTVGSWEGCRRRALEEGTDRWQDNAFVRGYQTAAPSRGRAVRGRAGGAASRASRRHDGGRSDRNCPPPALHETKDTRRKRWLLDPGRRIIPCPAGSGPAAASSYYSSTAVGRSNVLGRTAASRSPASQGKRRRRRKKGTAARNIRREKRGRTGGDASACSRRHGGRRDGSPGTRAQRGRMEGRAPAGVGERGPGDGGRRTGQGETGGRERERGRE